MSNARQGSVSHKFFEMVEAHKDDLAELHLRREIERIADEMGHEITIHKSTYHLGIFDYDEDKFMYSGPYTLQQCHDKLREISGENR